MPFADAPVGGRAAGFASRCAGLDPLLDFRRHGHGAYSISPSTACGVLAFTDASGFAWGARVDLPSGPLLLRDYWNSRLFRYDICSKEALAVLFAFCLIASKLYRRRVDVFVDNMGLVHA